ncbi:uncharacterized protein LOC142229945 [Haematobia irritans]|uniref:uncharacterized protein LOC142229945 n=1 Tax=Haematobia irritans TaxID=7368 RepID=UPI003F4F8FEB
MGGLWEAAVKSMKAHLKKIVTNWNFTFEEFTTLLVKIEAVLNSRPLCSVSEDPDELLPLTPGHFLRGAPLTAPPESPSIPPMKSLSYINRWERLKVIFHTFSQRWKAEYVTELQRRYKWKKVRNNIKEGDLVIVKEDSLHPTEWCLGRIKKIFFGKDNNVRVVEVKTKNGDIIRSIVNICLLPTTDTPSIPKFSSDK